LRSAGCALGALWLCSAVNLAGMRQAGRLQIVTTALKLLPLLLFGGIALWFVDSSHYRPFNPSGESLPNAVQATVALTLWAFLGLEAATVPAGSIRDAQRTIPRATIIGTLLAGVATILACTAVLGLLPADVVKSSQAPMADAARSLWGPAAGIGIAAIAAVSCFGALNGWVLISGQVPLAAARDGLLPQRFARLDAGGTPVFGVLVSSTLASILVLSNYTHSLVQLFTFSILLSTAATLLPYFASSAAWLWRGNGKGRVVAALALLYSLYALIGTGSESLLWGGALVVAGLPIYAWRKWRAGRLPAAKCSLWERLQPRDFTSLKSVKEPADEAAPTNSRVQPRKPVATSDPSAPAPERSTVRRGCDAPASFPSARSPSPAA
jgi:APA family basic amino acid/polyamine antiporter